MFSFINRTLFDIPITWDRSRFQTTRSKYRQARRSIEHSINIQLQKELKSIHLQNENIEKDITHINEYLSNHNQKVSVFENLTDIASETLSIHLERRMDNIQTTIEKQFSVIQNVLQEEKQYWKNLHSVLDQNLITIDDIHRSENPTSDKEERISCFSSSINKTFVIKPEEITNRLSSNEISAMNSESNSFSDFMQPKIILNRIGEGFLIDNLKLNEDIEQNSFYSQESKPEIKIERISFSLKRKQSVLDDNDDENQSISIIEIDDIKPKKRRKKKSKKKVNTQLSLDQSTYRNTRFSTQTQRLTNMTQSSSSSSFFRTRRKKS